MGTFGMGVWYMMSILLIRNILVGTSKNFLLLHMWPSLELSLISAHYY